MVRIYFFPNHSFDRDLIKSACICLRSFIVRIGPTGLSFDGGLILLLFRQAVQVPVPGPDNPLASDRV